MTTRIFERAVVCASFVALAISLVGQTAMAKKPPKLTVVDCDNGSIQTAVDKVNPGDTATIFITGECDEDVNITKDDITLSGNKMGNACNKADPSASADATIDGTITVDGVRARIEHLTITGSGDGVDIVNRANVHLVCNDISGNDGTGVTVLRSSNAVLRNNMLSSNGTRGATIPAFFDCGLFAADASSVNSRGNTYEDNRYCGIEIDRQASFRQGAFLPRETGGPPANPAERDVITEVGCTPSTGAGCDTSEGDTVAIEIFNGGLVDVRNIDVNGEIEVHALSSLRVDGDADILSNISNRFGSVVRLRSRDTLNREVTFTGTLSCTDTAQAFFTNVQCGQTCSGAIPGTCTGP